MLNDSHNYLLSESSIYIQLDFKKNGCMLYMHQMTRALVDTQS